MKTREVIESGRASLGIELGSTRIKACLIDSETHEVLASGGYSWENTLVDELWSYELGEVWAGIAESYTQIQAHVRREYGADISRLAAVGVSAMMHGYLAFDKTDALLVPFRTWRNTNTGPAASELTELFNVNIPHRWSIAHLRQAMLDDEPYLVALGHITTLAGYVHWQLTGERVLGVGDAAGMFPIDPLTRDYDNARIDAFAKLVGPQPWGDLRAILPEVRLAGEHAGTLSEHGAALIDPKGVLLPGALCAPPEGDAGTGMVATGAVAPCTGNVSVGTSIFAMVVLERPLQSIHSEIDLVATPSGDPVAMVHCNNGASELATWARMFEEFGREIGFTGSIDDVYATLFAAADQGALDAGGVLSYNLLSGEPVLGLDEGRPLVVRTPDAAFTLANFMRSQLYGVFAALSLGMRQLGQEGVRVQELQAHGGVFRTSTTAQQLLADALDVPVEIAKTAAEGGAWGMAILAAFRHASSFAGTTIPLHAYLASHANDSSHNTTSLPRPDVVQSYRNYLDFYRAGLAAERSAISALPTHISR